MDVGISVRENAEWGLDCIVKPLRGKNTLSHIHRGQCPDISVQHNQYSRHSGCFQDDPETNLSWSSHIENCDYPTNVKQSATLNPSES